MQLGAKLQQRSAAHLRVSMTSASSARLPSTEEEMGWGVPLLVPAGASDSSSLTAQGVACHSAR